MRSFSLFAFSVLFQFALPNTFYEDPFAQPDVNVLFNWTWFQAIPALIFYALFLRNGLRVVDEELTAEKSTRIRWHMTGVVCFAVLHSILYVVLVYNVDAVSVTYRLITLLSLLASSVLWGLLMVDYMAIFTEYDIWFFPMALCTLISCLCMTMIVPKSFHPLFYTLICNCFFGIYELVLMWRYGLKKYTLSEDVSLMELVCLIYCV
ncbi:hypothetical protein GCK72_016104 [Caenorhabditis remanei]|uniref:Uncharacterized protein n=1 Tax=Caenorhabditis remanei TaxID=31234 RepID=A0A6A5GWT3_CAERE|nr:hypothetical protein GCK72_016104 [Caenorhabditis remanei]KAF1759637.1 hypothetical protein GCK72_016104 [Caenorhabditis remanei]